VVAAAEAADVVDEANPVDADANTARATPDTARHLPLLLLKPPHQRLPPRPLPVRSAISKSLKLEDAEVVAAAAAADEVDAANPVDADASTARATPDTARHLPLLLQRPPLLKPLPVRSAISRS